MTLFLLSVLIGVYCLMRWILGREHVFNGQVLWQERASIFASVIVTSLFLFTSTDTKWKSTPPDTVVVRDTLIIRDTVRLVRTVFRVDTVKALGGPEDEKTGAPVLIGIQSNNSQNINVTGTTLIYGRDTLKAPKP